LYAVFFIPFYENEYKFVFSAAMCLAAFPALAVEKIWGEWPRRYAAPALAAVFLLVMGPYAKWAYDFWSVPGTMPGVHFEKKPSLDFSAFQVRLTQPPAWAGLCDAVFHLTPPNSILLVDDGDVYYPAFTDRSLYVAASNRIYPGTNLFLDDIDADVRGYGRQIIQQRRATLADVFGRTDDARREQALNVILALKRPVAIVEEARHSGLIEWLEHSKIATRLYSQDGLSLWLIDGASTLQISSAWGE